MGRIYRSRGYRDRDDYNRYNDYFRDDDDYRRGGLGRRGRRRRRHDSDDCRCRDRRRY